MIVLQKECVIYQKNTDEQKILYHTAKLLIDEYLPSKSISL